ncbi:delta-1-pyrroline-5-carboxylate synthase B-like [Capsella rubella]|uniref:delta-1-pyrroline-5-carboxylate synthase B-like n=1 Tax=Capsella rubella TaxID=81985 RepID=UPI000CD4DA73|nr:delta-1-pyrroline-5-carboxylate synthase B-like [Capsella rubella]
MEEMDRSRAFAKDVRRVVVKIGTAVVTGKDGRLALGRLGAICEQLAELNLEGFEVILVSSGAVGLGRHKLRYRQLLNSSLADLLKPQMEFDGKACAAVGQSSLMAYYETMFDKLDVTVAQVLVTDSSFRDKDFKKQLSDTVKSMLKMRVIPVFNENDAISTRRDPYEDSTGIFWDNDSLAALLSVELKADLLILLSDVEGLYSGPPSEPNSKLIHTFSKEQQQDITFGEKSRLGRGGMTAKVDAAVTAANSGIPVIITRYLVSSRCSFVDSGLRYYVSCWKLLQGKGLESFRPCLQKIGKKVLADIATTLKAENDLDVAAQQELGYD